MIRRILAILALLAAPAFVHAGITGLTVLRVSSSSVTLGWNSDSLATYPAASYTAGTTCSGTPTGFYQGAQICSLAMELTIPGLSAGQTYCFQVSDQLCYNGPIIPGGTINATTNLSDTPTSTPSNSPTSTTTFSNSPTSTPTYTATGTASPTVTKTWTRTVTATATATATPTATRTATITKTSTKTVTPTATRTDTPTASPTITVTATKTTTATASPSATGTASPTISPTFSISPTRTVSPTFTASPNWTATPTYTITRTFTASPTASPTVTVTPTSTPTPAALNYSTGHTTEQFGFVATGAAQAAVFTTQHMLTGLGSIYSVYIVDTVSGAVYVQGSGFITEVLPSDAPTFVSAGVPYVYGSSHTITLYVPAGLLTAGHQAKIVFSYIASN